MSKTGSRKARELYCRAMTVANLRHEETADSVAVAFLESARFYQLRKDNRRYSQILKRLEKALADGQPLQVCLASIESDIIEEVR